jgi:hypothetical protein
VDRGFVGATREEFSRSLIDLDLMTSEAYDSFLRGLPGDDRSPDGESLARALIEAGKLTRYQASAIYQGKAKILAIGEYIVLDRLGKGGMGVVFKARHRDFVDIVALKILTPSSSRNADSVRRFHREAKLLARLDHPNLVTAHGIGEHAGVYFLVMDHVDGIDLDQIVKAGGPLRPARAVDLVIQAARGLWVPPINVGSSTGTSSRRTSWSKARGRCVSSTLDWRGSSARARQATTWIPSWRGG